jgi:hypothetical protein
MLAPSYGTAEYHDAETQNLSIPPPTIMATTKAIRKSYLYLLIH